MSRPMAFFLVFCGLLLLMGGCTFISGWSNYDKEVHLRKGIQGKSNSNEASFDTMKKILSQKVQIANVGQTQLKEIYADLIEGRKGGALFKVVSEQYPDPEKAMSLWKDLMSSVEAERKIFLRDQKSIQDMVVERESLIAGFISRPMLKLFGGDTMPMKRKGHPEADGTPADHQYIFITSSDTERTSETGKEDDTDLGLGGKKPEKNGMFAPGQGPVK